MPFAIRKRAKSLPSPLGLTVVEMMILLAALALIILISVPGSSLLFGKYNLRSATNELFTGLDLARTEAQLRSATVVMCPSSNGHTCRKDGDWTLGWLVFSDGNGNGRVEDIEFIRSFDAPPTGIQIMAHGAVQAKAAFTVTGLVPDNEAKTGLFKICLDDPEKLPKLVKIDEDGWLQRIPTRNETCENS